MITSNPNTHIPEVKDNEKESIPCSFSSKLDSLAYKNEELTSAKNTTATTTSSSSSSSTTKTEMNPSLQENQKTAIDPSTTALILIDIQPEYWSQSPHKPYKQFPNFPSSVSKLIRTCRREDLSVIIWVRANYQPTTSPFLSEFQRFHGPNHVYPCITSNQDVSNLKWESFAQPNHNNKKGIKKEVIIPKPSISATTNTNLVSILQKLNIKTTLVAGLITSVCVHHSAFGLFEAGFRVIVVEDACADRTKDRHDMTLALYGEYCYDVMSANDVQDQMTSSLTKWNDECKHTNDESIIRQESMRIIPSDDVNRDFKGKRKMMDRNVCRIPKQQQQQQQQQQVTVQNRYYRMSFFIVMFVWSNMKRLEDRMRYVGNVGNYDLNNISTT